MCYEESFAEQFTNGAVGLTLSQAEKSYINDRYIPLVEQALCEAYKRSWQFHILVNFITVAGVLITTFVSLESSLRVPDSAQTGLYWTVVALGACVIIANKFLYIFGIHKKYIITQQTAEKYKTEGWMFLAGVGRYSEPPDRRILIFCNRIEHLQAKQIQEMTTVNMSSGANLSTSNSMLPDTPRGKVPPLRSPEKTILSDPS